MANFIGIAGDFQEKRALNRRLNLLLAIFLLMAVAYFLLGYAAAKASTWWSLAALVIVYPAFKVFERISERHLRLARIDETAAAGETSVIPFLKDLPDTYTVVSDLDFADGRDPATGEQFPPDSPYQQADTVRALYVALEALSSSASSAPSRDESPRRPVDSNRPKAGGQWSHEEELALCSAARFVRG